VQVKYNRGYEKLGVFRPISRFIPETIQDIAIVTMENEFLFVFHCNYGDISYAIYQMVPFPMTFKCFNDP